MSTARYKTFGPDAYVLGQPMLALVESINFDNFEGFLHARGLDRIEPMQWYSQQVWLDIFNDIAAGSRDASGDLVSIGMKIIDTMQTPPGFTSLPFEQMLSAFGDVYSKVNNRGRHIGSITIQWLDKQHVIMQDATPYPDDFIYGAYYAFARRFLPNGQSFKVYFDESFPRRDLGGQATFVHMDWN